MSAKREKRASERKEEKRTTPTASKVDSLRQAHGSKHNFISSTMPGFTVGLSTIQRNNLSITVWTY